MAFLKEVIPFPVSEMVSSELPVFPGFERRDSAFFISYVISAISDTGNVISADLCGIHKCHFCAQSK